MALVVEDGTGLANADSFISVADADAYHARYGNTGWLSADQVEKEVHLRRGLRYLVTRNEGRWEGQKKADAQALPFPRYGVYDADGLWVDENSVPRAIAEAQAELALRSLAGEDLQPDLEDGAVKRERLKAGSVEEEVEYVGGKRETKSFSVVEAMLAPFLRRPGRLVRS